MSNTRPTKVPEIPAPIAKPGRDAAFDEAVREALNILLARQGDPLDSAVRFRDLRDGGLASVTFIGGGGRGGIGGVGTGGTGGSPIFLNPSPPGTNPPPTGHLNVRTRSVWDGIMLQWDWPPGNIEYAYTEVWAAKQVEPLVIPVFAQAVLIGTAPGNLFVHTNLGLGATWYYWLRYVGFVPPNSATSAAPMSLYTPSNLGQGVKGVTAVDPTYVLAVLAGQIAEDQLAIGLGNRIDLVDYYYNSAGVRVPVPSVDIVDANGNIIPGSSRVQNVQNRVLAAVRDVDSTFRVAIAEEAAIRLLDDNTIAASYSVRADVDGYVVGFGFLATRTDTGGVLGETPPEFDSSFVIRANRFAIVHPQLTGSNLPEMVPFIVGNVDGISTVGINGQLVVDGTITARHIQANTIGANQINATEVWAGVVSANRVFASTFATSGDLNYRVEIGGQNETYPFWYGKGVKGGPDSVFFFDRDGSLSLAGNLTVSGVGRFSAANGAGTNRVEIGGGDQFLMWAGSGARTAANAKFYFDQNGTLFIRGNPLTFPVGSRSGSGQPTTSLTVLPVEGRSSSKVMVMGIASVNAGSGLYEKTIIVTIFANGTARDALISSTQDYSFDKTFFTVLDLAPGNYDFVMEVKVTATGGGNAIPTVSYFNGSMFALQLSSSS